jgi:hypothetical protein
MHTIPFDVAHPAIYFRPHALDALLARYDEAGAPTNGNIEVRRGTMARADGRSALGYLLSRQLNISKSSIPGDCLSGGIVVL